MKFSIALYQPEIPQNVGTILRLAACMDIAVHLIEPFGFVWHEPKLRRAGMDYIDNVEVIRHDSWESFKQANPHKQLVLLDVDGTGSIYKHQFLNEQILISGRESDGVPDNIKKDCYASIHIPMPGKGRSLNVAIATAIAVATAIPQL